MITFDFCGTSHGEGYRGIIRGIPAGTSVNVAFINENLAFRKGGLGRSSRQLFQDKVVFVGHEQDQEFFTDGADLQFFVPNECVEERADITAVRTGHADLVGQKRYPDMTARQIAEIASARSSLCYVVLGCICGEILRDWDIYTSYYVQQIGNVVSQDRLPTWHFMRNNINTEIFPCLDKQKALLMKEEIEKARVQGDSLGGVVCVMADAPMGIGEIFPYDKRLDAQISAQLMGIPSVKGISFGIGDEFAGCTGKDAHDSLSIDMSGNIQYKTNKCGGIVGGVTTGRPITIFLTVKPVPTVKGVQTIDTQTRQCVQQHYERADTCVVPTVGFVAQHLLNYVLANQVLKQYEENPHSIPKKKRREID